MIWVRTAIWIVLALLAITVLTIVLRGGVVPQDDPMLDGSGALPPSPSSATAAAG